MSDSVSTPNAPSQMLKKSQLLLVLKEAGEVFKLCARKMKILSALAWKPDVAQEFFRQKEASLPNPSYAVDKKALKDCLEALRGLAPKLVGDHPVLQWLTRMQESFVCGALLLLELEKDSFFEISSQLYGNTQTKLFNGMSSNLELSRAISARLSSSTYNDLGESMIQQSAEEFAARLEQRIRARTPLLPVKVELTDQIVAKVIAGMNRVRIRRDARFSDLELDALWNHEIESHCLTAHNGSLQDYCDFLHAGGPRTTMTQEGLAVFYEVYGHTMSQRRFITLCNRIEAVHMVEEGADFLQVYRWYRERSDTGMEAFYNTQRIFRGGRIGGSAPFTKDTVYLAGLFGVYNFLRIAVKNQNRMLVESLVCGRMALEDAAVIAWLRAHGLVNPPRYVPDWLKNWEALLSFFSLSAVLGNVDLTSFQGYFDEYYRLENWDLRV